MRSRSDHISWNTSSFERDRLGLPCAPPVLSISALRAARMWLIDPDTTYQSAKKIWNIGVFLLTKNVTRSRYFEMSRSFLGGKKCNIQNNFFLKNLWVSNWAIAWKPSSSHPITSYHHTAKKNYQKKKINPHLILSFNCVSENSMKRK